MLQFVFLLVSVSLVGAGNILLISTVPSVSHSLWYDNIAVLLADAGHQVTLINTKDPKMLSKNITYYIIESKTLYTEDLADVESFSKASSPFYGVSLLLGEWTAVECRILITSKTIKRFYEDFRGKTKPFDLIIFDGGTCECFLGLVDVLGRPPLIIATAYDSAFGLKLFSGNPDIPSISPHGMAKLTESMTFAERVESALIDGFARFMFHFIFLPGQNEMAKEVLGRDIANIEDIGRNATLFFIGTHYSIRDMKPLMPNVIQIAGIQLAKPAKLTTELQTFLDGATNGAIFFSFGSNVLCSWLSEEKRNMIKDGLGQLKYKVLWTCDVKGMKVPPNVKVAKWFPQKDILAHPNIKLFVTHGGLISYQEAMYYGIPLVVVPIFIDQHSVAYRIEKKGLGLRLLYHELKSPSQLAETIERVISDPSFKKQASAVSRVFKPFSDSTKSTFLNWVTFVLQNPDIKFPEAVSANLYWFQILLFDVLGALLIVAILVMVTVYYLLRYLLKLICKSKDVRKQKKS